MTKTVRDVMTMNPRCASLSTSVADAAKMLASEDVGSLPVLDGKNLVGMVTDRDSKNGTLTRYYPDRSIDWFDGNGVRTRWLKQSTQ